MEEKYYYVKGKTAWTFGNHFLDATNWEDSVLHDGVPPSAYLIEEYNLQSQTVIDDKNSTPTINFYENRDQFLSREEVKEINSKVPGLSTSNGDQPSPQKVDSMSLTSLSKRRHACSTCGKTYSSHGALFDHLRTHSRFKSFQCLQCDKSFFLKGSLQSHMKVHTGFKPYSCLLCSYSSSEKSNLTKHLRTHTGEKPFTCDVCEKSFSERGKLKQHRRIHSNENHFQDATNWEDSVLHDGVPPSVYLIEDYNMQSQTVIDDKSSTPTVNICENREQFLSGEEVKEINSKVPGLSTSNGDQPSPPQKVDSMSLTSLSKQRHACSTCGKTYSSHGALFNHLRTHSRVKSFQCLQCDKSFFLKGSLQSHMKVHTGFKPYSCLLCSYSSSEKSNLTKHLRTHTGEKPFTCDVCEKSFRERGKLKQHRQIHTNDKPYTCSTCQNSFTQNSNLKKHLLTHTKEKPHKCERCGKCFTQKGDLDLHTQLSKLWKKICSIKQSD